MNKRKYFIIIYGTIINGATDKEIQELWKYQEAQTKILNRLFNKQQTL